MSLETGINLYNEKKFEEAFKILYPLGVYERNHEALYYLGVMYFYGEGVEKDLEKAKLYWKKGRQNGSRDAAFRLSELEVSTKNIK